MGGKTEQLALWMPYAICRHFIHSKLDKVKQVVKRLLVLKIGKFDCK